MRKKSCMELKGVDGKDILAARRRGRERPAAPAARQELGASDQMGAGRRDARASRMPPAHRHALCWHCMRTALNTGCVRTLTAHRHRHKLRIDLSPRASADDCRASRRPAPRALPYR
ncbi:hypothetical protein RR48_13926 [Papilio machaon]|uniref:Uncharacterized protein n=1 Tax=Papilio machaon TaxID=76193 RepID=A0A194RIB7_PAPMA|nr:hypothetical protein RR48_13926 [Papilio machaon]